MRITSAVWIFNLIYVFFFFFKLVFYTHFYFRVTCYLHYVRYIELNDHYLMFSEPLKPAILYIYIGANYQFLHSIYPSIRPQIRQLEQFSSGDQSQQIIDFCSSTRNPRESPH